MIPFFKLVGTTGLPSPAQAVLTCRNAPPHF
jgi:hypothetical protein